MNNLGIFEDTIELKEVWLNNEKRIKKYKFKYGYASVLMGQQLKCYFAIEIKKKQLDKIEKDLLHELMGDIPFIMDFNQNSILFLRTELNDLFSNKIKKRSSLMNLLNFK